MSRLNRDRLLAAARLDDDATLRATMIAAAGSRDRLAGSDPIAAEVMADLAEVAAAVLDERRGLGREVDRAFGIPAAGDTSAWVERPA